MRYSNVFGPRQDPKSEAGVVSIFVSRLLEKRPLTIFGDGTQTRDYVFVADVARANLLAGTRALPPAGVHEARAFNIATSRETSVLELAATVGRVMHVPPVLEFAPTRPGELQRSALDVRKAGAMLGWTPEYSFENGLPQLIAWFKKENA
jgi:UDP-glucose 4-epimerase